MNDVLEKLYRQGWRPNKIVDAEIERLTAERDALTAELAAEHKTAEAVSEWNDDIEAAPRNTLVLGFVQYYEWPVVGTVIFPKSKRSTARGGPYNFKANDGRGTTYKAEYWMPLPPPPKGICY